MKARTFRHVVDHYPALFMNVEAGRLCRLAGMAAFATPFAASLVIAVCVRLRVHPARLHSRPTLLTLEHGHLVPQLPNGFGLLQRMFLQLGVLGSQMLEMRGQHAYEQPTILRQRRGQLTGSSVAAKPYSTFEHFYQ